MVENFYQGAPEYHGYFFALLRPQYRRLFSNERVHEKD